VKSHSCIVHVEKREVSLSYSFKCKQVREVNSLAKLNRNLHHDLFSISWEGHCLQRIYLKKRKPLIWYLLFTADYECARVWSLLLTCTMFGP